MIYGKQKKDDTYRNFKFNSIFFFFFFWKQLHRAMQCYEIERLRKNCTARLSNQIKNTRIDTWVPDLRSISFISSLS